MKKLYSFDPGTGLLKRATSPRGRHYSPSSVVLGGSFFDMADDYTLESFTP